MCLPVFLIGSGTSVLFAAVDKNPAYNKLPIISTTRAIHKQLLRAEHSSRILIGSELTNTNRWHVAEKGKGKGNSEGGTLSDGQPPETAYKVKWHLGRDLKTHM